MWEAPYDEASEEIEERGDESVDEEPSTSKLLSMAPTEHRDSACARVVVRCCENLWKYGERGGTPSQRLAYESPSADDGAVWPKTWERIV